MLTFVTTFICLHALDAIVTVVVRFSALSLLFGGFVKKELSCACFLRNVFIFLGGGSLFASESRLVFIVS